MPWTDARQTWTPAPTLPLVYFTAAHVALVTAATLLAWMPDVAGGFHYHPRLIALVHLITLGWISASILGSLYIVGPLALGAPLPVRRRDYVACVAYLSGAVGMVVGFWRANYAWVGCASAGVLVAVTFVGGRVLRRLPGARLPVGVSLHIALAFANVLVAGIGGAVIAFARAQGALTISPMTLAVTHAHVAMIGWVVMMVIGIAYRLVPMFLPAAMPAGRPLLVSAILIETGLVGLTTVLLASRSGDALLPWALAIVGGLIAFARQARRILSDRKPRPVDLPRRDWSVWQTHVALAWLFVAAMLGLWLAGRGATPTTSWVYGVVGLLGFGAQMVVGIQGRLLPLHAWYRAMAQRRGEPPTRSSHRLADSRLACAVFLLWLAAVPSLAFGLSYQATFAIAGAATLLALATLLQFLHMARIVQRAQ